ncbi:MAG: molybdopterin-dependent oxidoreductase, partial [Anaerolineales bacterium]|nr:molybdopterin-dependent oxidoreductase [Anaerolineales bacterium]
MEKIPASEITPEHLYLTRRQFIAAASAVAAGALLSACGVPTPTPTTQPIIAQPSPQASKGVDELGDKLTPFDTVTNYNNFYEFSLDKEDVAPRARDFKTSPWTVQVGGLVNQPRTFGLEDLLKFEQEERVYRLRCVEAWSMVIPWLGFPLSKLLAQVEPQSKAKYVRFETLLDPKQMPGQR